MTSVTHTSTHMHTHTGLSATSFQGEPCFASHPLFPAVPAEENHWD